MESLSILQAWVERESLLKLSILNFTKSTFEIIYNKLTCRYGNSLKCANDLRNTPTSDNIEHYDFTYYPGYVFQYAFGCVSNKTFRNWNTFSTALKEEVTKRLKVLYKKDLFYDFKDKIEQAFTNSILIIDYDRGGGMKIRMSLAGIRISSSLLERDIKTIPTYANATVNVRHVMGMEDVVDIQIIMNEKQFLSKPNWAYKAMEVKINSGEPLDLNTGIPIGRKVDGEIVNFTFNPSSDFITLICAGSGAGKGVLTLSMLGAALGNKLPVFYIDYKPDMASVFWDLEEQLKIHTFAIDGLTSKPRQDINGNLLSPGYNVPDGLKGIVKQYGGTITYIKCLQLMCAMARYRADNGFESNLLFVFDEIQAAQKVIKAMMSTIYIEMKIRKPKAKEEPSEEYLYLKAIADLVKDTDTNFTTYLNTTGRASGIFSVFIGQSPNWDVWAASAIQPNGDYGKMDLFGQVTKAGTVRKLIGKGAGSSKYGLSTLAKNDPVGKRYVEENRFFGMYYGNNCEGVEVTVFKPFLTLNSDDISQKCWTNGIGREYGYKGKDSIAFEKYRANVAAVHPGDNQYGVHKGTGFLGLTGMYCNQDTERIKSALISSYVYSTEFMRKVGLDQTYKSVEELIYDVSQDGIMDVNTILNYARHLEGNDAEDNDGTSEEEILTDISYDGDEVDAEPIDFGIEEDLVHGSEDMENVNGNTSNVGGFTGKTYSVDADEELAREKAYANNGGKVEENTSNESEWDMLDEELNNMKSQLSANENTSNDEEKMETDGDYSGRPICVNSNEQILGFIDKLSKLIAINSEAAKNNAINLNRDNSIDCTRCHSNPKSWRDNFLIKTPRGQDKMSTLLWKDILDTIESNGFKGAVLTRLSIHGNQMYINGRIVNLNGVIGGPQAVRLQDIVQFGSTFKRFRFIRELRIDDTILDSLILELGDDAIDKMFSMEDSLVYMIVEHTNGTYTKVTRDDVVNQKNERAIAGMNDKIKERQGRMAFDAECKARNTDKLGKRGPSYDLSANKLAKASFGNASAHLLKSSKPSLVKGFAWGALGITAGALAVTGGLLSGGYNAIKGLTNVGK